MFPNSLMSVRPEVPLVSLFIVENIPMLHAMAQSARERLAAERPQAVLPTTLALYTAATLLTATAFLFCGDLRWDGDGWRWGGLYRPTSGCHPNLEDFPMGNWRFDDWPLGVPLGTIRIQKEDFIHGKTGDI